MKILQSLLSEMFSDDNFDSPQTSIKANKKVAITRTEIANIFADNEKEAKQAIDDIFPTVSKEDKAQALKVWLALNKNKIM